MFPSTITDTAKYNPTRNIKPPTTQAIRDTVHLPKSSGFLFSTLNPRQNTPAPAGVKAKGNAAQNTIGESSRISLKSGIGKSQLEENREFPLSPTFWSNLLPTRLLPAPLPRWSLSRSIDLPHWSHLLPALAVLPLPVAVHQPSLVKLEGGDDYGARWPPAAAARCQSWADPKPVPCQICFEFFRGGCLVVPNCW